MKKQKILRNQAGFSLVQVIIYGFVLAASSTLLISLNSNMNKKIATSIAKTTRDRIFNELSLIAADPDALIVSSWNDQRLNACINPNYGGASSQVLATISTGDCPLNFNLQKQVVSGEPQKLCCQVGNCTANSGNCLLNKNGSPNPFILYDRMGNRVAGSNANPIYYSNNGTIQTSPVGASFQATANLYLNGSNTMQVKITVSPIALTPGAGIQSVSNDGSHGQPPAIMSQALGSVALKNYTGLTNDQIKGTSCTLGSISASETGIYLCGPPSSTASLQTGVWGQVIPNPNNPNQSCSSIPGGGTMTVCYSVTGQPLGSVCQVQGSACPSGWTQYGQCSTTSTNPPPKGCQASQSGQGIKNLGWQQCNPQYSIGSHNTMINLVEKCQAWYGRNNCSISANVTSVGCVP